MKRTTVFLDQGEFMGGAEHFLLDFLSHLTPTERRRLNPLVLGGESPEYQSRLGSAIERKNFVLPSVKGGKIAKAKALWDLLWTAKKLKAVLKNQPHAQLFTNTPRAHLTALLLKKVWGWKGHWIAMVHDFTTRPESVVQQIGTYADVIIANSLPTRQWLRSQLKNTDHDKIRIIENGVGLIKEVTPAAEVTKVLNLGRIDPRKGQRYFAESADLLQDRNPDLRFNVVGDSVQTDAPTVEYEKEIQQFAKDRQLKNLVFAPSVSDPLSTIQASDSLVFTPTEGETFGRVVIEALACGKLVIAFEQTGPKEILEHYQRYLTQKKGLDLPGQSPLLVEANNAMSLAETIAYFADNPGEVENYTEYAAEFVQQHYSLAETKKRLLEVLLG